MHSSLITQIQTNPAKIQLRTDTLDVSRVVPQQPLNMRVGIEPNSIASVQAELNRLKVDPQIKDTFLRHLDDIGIRVDKIQGKWVEVAGSEERALSLSIQGTDQYQRTVSLLEMYDMEGQQIESTQRSITLNVQKQREEHERLTKQAELDNDKRLSYLTKQQSILDNIQSKYKGETSSKGILDPIHLEALNNKYIEIQDKIKSFTETSGNLSKTQKADIESQIVSLQRMAQSYQNIEYVATSLRTKDVSTINREQLDKLNAYEEKLRASGLLTQEFQQKIANLRSELGSAFDSASLTSYLNSFDGLQSNVTALQEKIRNVNSLYAELGQVATKINEVQKKIVSLDPAKDANKITSLQQELNIYQKQFEQINAQIVSYGEIINLSQQRQIYEQQTESLAARLATAEAEVADKANTIDAAMKNIPQTVERIGNSFNNLKNKPQELGEQIAQLKTLMDAVNNADTAQRKISAYNQLKEAIKNCQTGLANFSALESTAIQTDQIQTRARTLSNNIQAWMNLNQQATQRFGAELQKLMSKLQSGSLSSSDLRNLTLQFGEIKSQAKAAGLSTNLFADSLKNTAKQLLGLTSGVMVIRKVIQAVKQATNTIVELDTALVDLKKTTTMSGSDLTAFYKDANKAARELGLTTKEIIQSASDWSRLGFSDKKSSESMAKLAAQFSAISPGVDIEQATTGLVSVIKAYGIEVDDVLDGVMSKINKIGNTAATSNDQIITGLQKSASAMAAMNSTLDENIALFTAAQEIVQNDSQVGNAIRSVSMRVRGYSEDTGELSEELANISGEVYDLTKVTEDAQGVSLFTDETQQHYKSVYNYLKEISEIYDKLSEKQQQALMEKLFGKNRANVGQAILQNFEAAEKAMANMADSAGSADAEMAIITESLEYKLNALSETGVGIIQNMFPREDIAVAVDTLTEILEIIETITSALGPLGTAIASIGIAAFVKNLGSLKSVANLSRTLGESVIAVSSLERALDGMSKTQIAAAINSSKLNASQIATALSSAGTTKAVIAEQLALLGYSKEATIAALVTENFTREQAEAAVVGISFASAEGTATVATGGLSAALKGLWAVMKAHPIISIASALLAGLVAITQWRKHSKEATREAQQAAKDASQSYLEAGKSLEEYKTKIAELREEIDSGNLSEEEAYEKRKQLISIQDEVVDRIGNEAKAFDILKGSLDDVNSAFDHYSAKQAINLLGENKDTFDTAANEMKKIRKNLGSGMDNTIANDNFINLPENKEIYKQVQQIFESVFGNNVHFKELGDGRIAYELEVDARAAVDGLAEVNHQMYNLDKELSRDGRSLNKVLGLDSFDQSWENAVTAAKKQAQEILDEFSDNYNNMIQLKIQASFDPDDKNNAANLMAQIKKFQDEYANAIAESNKDSAEQAYENMQGIVPKIAEIKDEDIVNYLNDVIEAFNEKAKKTAFEIDIKAKLSDGKDSVGKMVKNAVRQFQNESGKFDKTVFLETKYNFENSGRTTVSNAEERAYMDLQTATEEYGGSVEDLIDILEELGYIQSDNASIAHNTESEMSSLTDTISTLADAEKDISGLSDVMSEFSANGSVTAASLSELAETFGNLDSFDDFIKVMTDSSSSVEEAQIAWSKLAGEYIDSMSILDNLNESNMDVVESFLSQMGVVNAHGVVLSRLSAEKLNAVVAANGLSQATWEETQKFLEQEGVSKSTQEALRQYRIEQLAAALSATNLATASSSTVSALLSQANAAGVAASSLAALKSSMAALAYDHDTYNPEKSTVGLGGIRAYEKKAAKKNQKEKSEKIEFDFSKIKNIGGGSSGGSGSSSKSEDPTEKLKKELDKLLSDFEHKVFILEKKGVSNATESAADRATKTVRQIIDIYHQMQSAVNKQANTYREMGLADNSDEIKELQKQWWEYKENVQDVMTSCYEYIRKEHENTITLNEDWLEGAIAKNDRAGVTKYTGEIVAQYKAMQDELHAQAEYYRSLGYSDTSEEVSTLSDQWWQYYNEIKEVSAKAWQEILDNMHGALDEIENVYDTLHNAAQEFADNGYIKVSTFQEIARLGVENLSYLQDENGLLVINEENIQKVIAARTQQMAIETALNYIQQIRQALLDNDTQALMNLATATNIASDSTWDLVYAQLNMLKVSDKMTDDLYNSYLNNINNLRSLADIAVESIGQVDGALEAARKESYEYAKKQSDALDDLLKYVMEMIRQEVKNQIDAINKQVEAMRDLIDAQKKSLDMEREKDKYSQSVAEKTKNLAKLQQQLTLQELDDSRESKAKQEKLREEIAELSKDLSDEQADHAYDATSDALDDMLTAYEKEKNKEIEILENSISSEEKVYRLAIERIQTQWGSLYDQLITWNTEYGSVINQEISNAWDSACEAVEKYGSYLDAILATQKEIAEYEARSNSSYTYSSGDSSESSEKNNSSNAVGNKGNYDSSGGQELAQAKNIFKQMYRNAQAWAATNDPAERSRLDEANMKLGTQDLARYGIRAYRKNGAWYDADGSLLFEKYKEYLYHNGGVAGNHPTQKQKEIQATLEKGEMVLTEKQQNNLYRVLDKEETLLYKYGNFFEKLAGTNLLTGQMEGQISQLAQPPQNIVERNGGNVYEINVPVQVVQKLDESEIRGLKRTISDYTIKEIDSAFALRGKRSFRR